MAIESSYIFYFVGIVFLFVAFLYLAVNVFSKLDPSLKIILLFLLVILNFFIGEFLREVNK